MSVKALIVGVNKYKLPGSDLQGCVNDATNVRDILLKYYGFTTNDIRVLVDARATKSAIISAKHSGMSRAPLPAPSFSSACEPL